MSPGQCESLNPSRFGRPLVVDIVRDDGPAPPVAASRPPAVGKGWPVYTASLTARLADFGQHPTGRWSAPIRLKMVNRPPTVYWKKWSLLAAVTGPTRLRKWPPLSGIFFSRSNRGTDLNLLSWSGE